MDNKSQTIGSDTKSILILGGGFGGLNTAKKLAKNKNLQITLIDKRNYHLFQPLLYQVAMAGLSPAEIAVPIRSLLVDYPNVRVFMESIIDINLEKRCLSSKDHQYTYDYLVLACGAQHSYFGKNQWEPFAPGLKTLEQATEIRRRVLNSFEKAEREPKPELRKSLQTFVVVGGGPTGVELAGALGEISRHTLNREFRNIDPTRTRILLIEAGSRILPSFKEGLARKAAADLEQLGVQVWNNCRVTDISPRGVQIGEEYVQASTVLWAAGVQPSDLNSKLGVELDQQGRVLVEQDLSLKNHPDVFVLGDQACFQDSELGILPGLATVAMQQSSITALNIQADIKGTPRKPFKYWDKGQMATIGRRKAILQTRSLQLSGILAWLGWLLVHIYYLIGFKNRVFVLLQWLTSYLSYKRGARLIVAKSWRSFKK